MDSLPDHLKALIFSRVQQSRAVVDSSDVLPSAVFAAALPQPFDALLSRGFVVLDDFLPAELWRTLCTQVRCLRPRMKQAGMISSNNSNDGKNKNYTDSNNNNDDINSNSKQTISNSSNNNNNNTVLDSSFRGDLHLWISDWKFDEEDIDERSAEFSAIFELLKKLRHLQDEVLRIEQSNSRQTQVTCYPGNGAKYTRHLDASKGRAESRLVTFVYYANDCEWEEKMGGQLRVFLSDGHKDIAPIGNRLLIFQSRLIEHSVEPCYFERYAISQWVSK